MKLIATIFLLCLSFQLEAQPTWHKALVSVPVADLKSTPQPTDVSKQPPLWYRDAPNQETQCVFNEKMLVKESADPNWYEARPLEQFEFNENTWKPCAGCMIEKNKVTLVENFPKYNLVTQSLWTPVFSSPDQQAQILNLSLGSMLEGTRINNNFWQINLPNNRIGFVSVNDIYEFSKHDLDREFILRNHVVSVAKKLVNSFYIWGGRSAAFFDQTGRHVKLDNQITGVDCSGLVNLAFRAAGLNVPRNSKDQKNAATMIESGKDLLPGDLIFFHDLNKGRVTHVIIYIGEDLIIESTGSSTWDGVLIQKLSDRFRVDKEAIVNGQDYEIKCYKQGTEKTDRFEFIPYKIFLGTFFRPIEQLNARRKLALA